MADLNAEQRDADAEYVRHVSPVLIAYTRQVLMEVDLPRLRKASEAEGDAAAVVWLDAMEAARLAFSDMERAQDRAERDAQAVRMAARATTTPTLTATCSSTAEDLNE